MYQNLLTDTIPVSYSRGGIFHVPEFTNRYEDQSVFQGEVFSMYQYMLTDSKTRLSFQGEVISLYQYVLTDSKTRLSFQGEVFSMYQYMLTDSKTRLSFKVRYFLCTSIC